MTSNLRYRSSRHAVNGFVRRCRRRQLVLSLGAAQVGGFSKTLDTHLRRSKIELCVGRVVSPGRRGLYLAALHSCAVSPGRLPVRRSAAGSEPQPPPGALAPHLISGGVGPTSPSEPPTPPLSTSTAPELPTERRRVMRRTSPPTWSRTC
jgi:hypothetical protein